MMGATRTLTVDRRIGTCLFPYLIGWVARIEHGFKARSNVGSRRLRSMVESEFS